nr:hypothetical protein [Dyella sp. ASV24]
MLDFTELADSGRTEHRIRQRLNTPPVLAMGLYTSHWWDCINLSKPLV